jgi:prepilin peptidase CpaA
MIEAAVLLFFPILMAFAAWSDLLTMTISNRISLALVAGFLPLAYLTGASGETILLHLGCGAAVLLLTFSMFCAGWIGGGDAKLAAATAVWLGFERLLDFGLVASCLGGILTLLVLVARTMPLPQVLLRQPWIARLHDEKTGIPYGIALATAGLLIYPETLIWLRAATA